MLCEMSGDYAIPSPDDLVTGEAVALELPAAGLALRIASGLIDVVVTVVLLIAAAFLAALASIRSDEALQQVALVAVTVSAFVIFPTTLETLTRGRSLGKLATGLRTVRDDGGPITFQQAFIRALVGFVEIYASSGIPAFFSALLSQRSKRLGDHAAGTHVVRERVHLALPPPAQMPGPLRAWAASADVAPLPVGLSLAIRQFLGRVHQITPQSRAAVAGQLASRVAPHVAPPPPPGTPPEAFLAAVIALRRERDAQRLRREAQLRARLNPRR